jgi:hypothetical protein
LAMWTNQNSSTATIWFLADNKLPRDRLSIPGKTSNFFSFYIAVTD